jgi:RIO kinase 1
LGVPVPYPVQIDGTEILMELVEVERERPPRLARMRPGPALLASYFEQLREAMLTMASAGIVPATSRRTTPQRRDRLVIIDLPQVATWWPTRRDADFLMRDCHNMCTWFRARGLDVDEHQLFADLLSSAW